MAYCVPDTVLSSYMLSHLIFTPIINTHILLYLTLEEMETEKIK